MKLELFPVILLALTVFFVIVTTALFYIRHWASRHSAGTMGTATEGIYFKRYIPEQLRDPYDNRRRRNVNSRDDSSQPFWARFLSAVIIATAVAVPVISLVKNTSMFLSPIDLTPGEIAALDVTRHEWQRQVDGQLPNLNAVLAMTKKRGFIIPFDKKDETWLLNGINIKKMALDHWRNFIERNKFDMARCNWQTLHSCRARHDKWLILVLPGYWDFEALDNALNKGANVIVYGAPAQLFSKRKENLILWRGLAFEEVIKKENGALILRGDQLLTLGFDAGLIINVDSSFAGFQVRAMSPQAISIGNVSDAGGETITRLYARTVGPGRLVWLDFAPDPKYHAATLNLRYFDALLASIFRYVSQQSYSAIATWPHAREFAALIEEDTEDKMENAQAVINIVVQNNYPISWFILSNEALKHRTLVRAMAGAGEIACHGDNHGAFTKSSPREQVARIARCQKVLTGITGVVPLAFRPPEEAYNAATIDAIANNRMTHYIAENSPDRAVPEILLSNDGKTTLVSIPRMVNDDYEIWHTRNLNHTQTLQLIDTEIAWMRHIGGLYMFSFHTQYMDKRDNVHTIEHMGNKLKQLDAYFATAKDIAEWWRFRTTLQGVNRDTGQTDKYTTAKLIARLHPVLLSVNSNGELVKSPFHVKAK